MSASGLKVFSPEGGTRTAGAVRPRGECFYNTHQPGGRHMRLRLDLPLMNVSPSGLRKLCGYVPVADATGKDMSASGLKNLPGLLDRCMTPPAGICRPTA